MKAVDQTRRADWKIRVVYVFTASRDSLFLGEDGPTHQPVEHLGRVRNIPGLRVIRPCDANETASGVAGRS